MQSFQFRDYQLEAIDKVRASFVQGARTVCLVAPTGAGKTAIALEIARRAVHKGTRVVWYTHRTELKNQVSGVNVQTIQSSLTVHEAELVIIDECHHYESDEWSEIYNVYKNSRIIGLTATPQRADGRGLRNHYEAMVVAITPGELRDRGVLVPCDIFCPETLLKPGQIAQEPYVAWSSNARGAKTIIYCRDIKHAQRVADSFDGAHLVTSETPASERAAIINKYRHGEIRVLVNVNILTEGFDAPETECVVIARGISHASTYLQIIGRALRCAPGKERAILLDLRGVSHVFGEPYDERVYSLDGKGIRKKDLFNERFCPVCSALIDDLPCDACGYDTEEARQVRIMNSPLVRYAKMRAQGPDKRRETFLKWSAIARANGYRPGWAAYKYKSVYGHWPSKE